MAIESNSVRTKIEKTIDSLYAALSDHDIEKVVEAYADHNVMFTLAPPLQFVPENAPGAGGVKEWLDGFAEGPNYEVKDRHVVMSDDLAVEHSLTHMMGRKKSGENVDLWYRETCVLKNENGSWKISHQHESVPFYMDDEKRAAVDLKPESMEFN